MTVEKNIICTVCPMGCQVKVRLVGTKVEHISGYTCKRGREYALAECINPVRTLTSTVKVKNGKFPVAPVKSNRPLPKHLILECINEINKCMVDAPLRIGDIIIKNVLDTGSDIVATGNIPVLKEYMALDV